MAARRHNPAGEPAERELVIGHLFAAPRKLGWKAWVQTMAVIACLSFSLSVSAAKEPTREAMNRIEPLPRDLEIQLALSALPPHLREKATVYVLNPEKGFEVARKGTNGFHAFVVRTDEAAFRGSSSFAEYREPTKTSAGNP